MPTLSDALLLPCRGEPLFICVTLRCFELSITMQKIQCYSWCSGEQWASSYCIRKGLIRKAHLAHNLKKWAAKHPHGLLAASVPETHVMEVDDVEYIDEALADVYEVMADFPKF